MICNSWCLAPVPGPSSTARVVLERQRQTPRACVHPRLVQTAPKRFPLRPCLRPPAPEPTRAAAASSGQCFVLCLQLAASSPSFVKCIQLAGPFPGGREPCGLHCPRCPGPPPCPPDPWCGTERSGWPSGVAVARKHPPLARKWRFRSLPQAVPCAGERLPLPLRYVGSVEELWL